jgi:hypothetical protein
VESLKEEKQEEEEKVKEEMEQGVREATIIA